MNEITVDPILEEIKTATGWDHVEKKPEGYLIYFNESDASRIHGLSKNNSTFFLEFDNLKEIPIAFHIIRGNRYFQYWTLNYQIHRTSDKPAYIMYDGDNNRYHKRWFWHGLLHRSIRPAEEIAFGYRMDDTIIDSHIREEYSQLKLEWWVEGKRVRGNSSSPSYATLRDGWRCKNKITGLLDWPDSSWPTVFAKNVRIVWETINYNYSSSDTSDNGNLIPTSLDAIQFSEIYEQGKLKNRTCDSLDIHWKHNNREINATDTNNVKLNSFIKDNLFTDMGLLDGPLYSDAETEMILLSEYNRIFNGE